MAIVIGDIKLKRSVKTGSAGNSTAQADPNASLGKYISTTEWAGGTINDLFDNVSGAENAASTVDYRCIFFHNSHASLAWQSPKVWVSAQVSGGTSVAIGVDTNAQSLIGASAAQAVEVANETTAPSGVSFSTPTTEGTALSLGSTLDAGKCVAIWFRRTAANSAALDADGVTLGFSGDTAA